MTTWTWLLLAAAVLIGEATQHRTNWIGKLFCLRWRTQP